MTRILSFFTAILMLISLAAGTYAESEDILSTGTQIGYNRAVIWLRTGTENKTIVFFSGSGQRFSIERTVARIAGQVALSDYNLVCCALEPPEDGGVEQWKYAVEAAAQALKDYGLENTEICVEGESYGGWPVHLFVSTWGGSVNEVSLFDAALDYVYTEKVIREWLDRGIRVNMYASRPSDKNVSKRSRELIRTLRGTEGFSGKIYGAPHGLILQQAYTDGLHKKS